MLELDPGPAGQVWYEVSFPTVPQGDKKKIPGPPQVATGKWSENASQWPSTSLGAHVRPGASLQANTDTESLTDTDRLDRLTAPGWDPQPRLEWMPTPTGLSLFCVVSALVATVPVLVSTLYPYEVCFFCFFVLESGRYACS